MNTKLSAAAMLTVMAGVVVAEQPLMTPAQLKEHSTNILVGKIQNIYTNESKDENFAYLNGVVEISVQSIEKGEGIRKGDLVYVRYWRKHWTGNKDTVPLFASGHYAIELEKGSTARAFVARNKDDRGFDILLTNGLQKVNNEKRTPKK